MAHSKEDDRTKKAVDKSPVHATILPTMDMTKKSEAQIEGNSEEKILNNNAHLPVESAEETASQIVQKGDAKTMELRGALLTMKQPPNYQTLPIKKSESKNEGDTIDETKEITAVTNSLAAKTIMEKQDETMAQSKPKSQDKETETLKVRSTMPAELEVDQQVLKEELHVQGVVVSRQDANPDVDRIEPPSSRDYVYPFTLGMAIWQDFVLSAVNIYNQFARELSKVNGTWMNIFLNVRQSSNHDKKYEDK
jgi:hypothetical protein